MTHERRTDPADDTRVVERDTYRDRDPDPDYERVDDRDPGYVPPAERRGSQVNVNTGGSRTYVDEGPGALYYARRVISLLFGILAVLIGLRILLLLLVANEQNAIVDFVYDVTEPFVAPFRGIFNFDTVSPGGASVLDVAALVALIGWVLIYVLLMAILRIGDRRAV